MTNIKEILPYYVGRPFWTSNSQGEINVHTLPYILDMIIRGVKVQLQLRRLEDMADEEATELATICYHAIYGNGELTIQQTFDSDHGYHFGAHFRDDHSDRVGFTVDVEKGVELSVNGIKLNVNQFVATHYLLKQGFDLYGLIESGQAIDQKTLNEKL